MSGPSKLKVIAYYTLLRERFLLDQRGASALDQYQDTREQLLQLTTQYDRLVFNQHFLTVEAEGFVASNA